MSRGNQVRVIHLLLLHIFSALGLQDYEYFTIVLTLSNFIHISHCDSLYVRS